MGPNFNQFPKLAPCRKLQKSETCDIWWIHSKPEQNMYSKKIKRYRYRENLLDNFKKKSFWITGCIILKWSKLVPFCGRDHQKSNFFYWYLLAYLSEAVEASQCYFFENWMMQLKFPNLLQPLGTIIVWQNHRSF